MSYDSIVISSGHGLYVRGASGILDEVDEARLVVERVAEALRFGGTLVKTFHDDVSVSQNENLNRIVDFHNAQVRDLDISVHFNAYEQVDKPMGTEVLYLTQLGLAQQMSAAIASCGLIDRGAKKRTDLFFLNQTAAPSILIETCFVDSEADAEAYGSNFETICETIARTVGKMAPEPAVVPPVVYSTTGRVSAFGGPHDMGVAVDEGLALISDVDQLPWAFLPSQPEGTTGLARRLNPYVHYLACRWDYAKVPKAEIIKEMALVRATRTGVELTAFPVDWGPHEDTGRVADLSPGLLTDLGIETDDEVEVLFPYQETGV